MHTLAYLECMSLISNSVLVRICLGVHVFNNASAYARLGGHAIPNANAYARLGGHAIRNASAYTRLGVHVNNASMCIFAFLGHRRRTRCRSPDLEGQKRTVSSFLQRSLPWIIPGDEARPVGIKRDLWGGSTSSGKETRPLGRKQYQ